MQLWFQRLKDSGANKRLNLIYLANGVWWFSASYQAGSKDGAADVRHIEVAQQSKVRRKTDFLIAFSPVRLPTQS